MAGFLRGVFFENLGLKLLSLVLAVGFYVFIHGGERAQRRFAVPVVAIVPPDDANRKLVDPPPTEISITVSGPKTQIDALRGSDVGTVQLDLHTGFETTVQIKPELFTVPAGLTLEEIFPKQIEVRWDDIITRKIPVELRRSGEPAAGFSMKGPILVKPDVIDATGPRRIVELIQSARTAPFEIASFEEGSHSVSVDLQPPPPSVTFDTEQVTATLELLREEHEVSFKAIPVEVVGQPTLIVKPKTVTITARGMRETVNALQADSIVPRVELPADVDLKKPGSRYLDVILTISNVVVTIDPPQVLVKWGEKEKP
ncbi:MAG: CdaR family protein [Polyangiaceae bacterium]